MIICSSRVPDDGGEAITAGGDPRGTTHLLPTGRVCEVLHREQGNVDILEARVFHVGWEYQRRESFSPGRECSRKASPSCREVSGVPLKFSLRISRGGVEMINFDHGVRDKH